MSKNVEKIDNAVVNEENIVDGEIKEEKTFGQKVGDKIDAGIGFGKKVVTSKPVKVIGGIALIGGAVLAGAALFGKSENGGEIEAADDPNAIDTTSTDVVTDVGTFWTEAKSDPNIEVTEF